MNRLWSIVTLALVTGTASSAVAQTLTGPNNYPSTRYPVANAFTADRASRMTDIEAQPPAPPAPTKAKPVPQKHHHDGQAASKTDWIGGTCAECGLAACGCGGWYGRAGASFMTRDGDNRVWFSFDTGNLGSVFLNSNDIGGGWGWGADVVLGYALNGGGAIEASYWGIYPGTRAGTAFDPDGATGTANDLDSTFAFDSLDYNGGTVADFYQNAEMHILRRTYEAHNVEINYVGTPYGAGCYGNQCGWNWRWLAGVRYLKFNDGFEYITDDADQVLTGDPNEVYYTVDVDNHLIGVQVGGGLDFWFTDRLSFYANAKVGLFGVHMTNRSRIGGSAGDAVVNNPLSPYNGLAFNVNSTKDDVAMLGELDLGMRYAFSNHWSFVGGYRAVGISGVALSTNQIPQYFADIGGVQDIDSNGSVILHGGYFGFEFLY